VQVSVPRRPLHGAEFLFRKTVATIAELELRGEEGHVFEPRCDAARLATQVSKSDQQRSLLRFYSLTEKNFTI
jgi:hypothetical protein